MPLKVDHVDLLNALQGYECSSVPPPAVPSMALATSISLEEGLRPVDARRQQLRVVHSHALKGRTS